MKNLRQINQSELFALEIHPLAQLFPECDHDVFAGLVADIAENGFRKDRPIIILDGQILDGRNRRATALEALAAGAIDHVWVADYDNQCQSTLDYVLSENLNRRHLSTSQKAVVAANLAQWELGMNQHDEKAANLPTQKQIAQKLSISERALRSARRVVERSPDLEGAVRTGKLAVSAAETLLALGDKELSEVLQKDRRDIVARAKEIREENSRVSHAANIGNKTRTKEERGHNLYETPACATHALLKLETFSEKIWEPSCGRGAISRVLEEAGYEVALSDLVDYGTCAENGAPQIVSDFLQTKSKDFTFDVVTNPPYGDLLNAYVAHAVRMAVEGGKVNKVAMLMNINVLCGSEDADREYFMEAQKPARIYVFKRRLPMMHQDGWDGPKASSSMNTGWFVWEVGFQGNTEIIRVDWKDYYEVCDG